MKSTLYIIPIVGSGEGKSIHLMKSPRKQTNKQVYKFEKFLLRKYFSSPIPYIQWARHHRLNCVLNASLPHFLTYKPTISVYENQNPQN